MREHVQTESIIANFPPTQILNIDYLQLGGGYYLVVVDRFSGFTWCRKTQKQSTDEAMKMLCDLWNLNGFSKEIRSDSGTAFRLNFEKRLEELGVSISHSFHIMHQVTVWWKEWWGK